MFTKIKLRRLIDYYSRKQWDRLFKVSKGLKKSKDLTVKADALRYEGLAYYKLKKYDEAEQDFKTLSSLVNYRTDWFNLAMCYSKMKATEKSEAAFQKIYSSPPISGYKHQISIPMMLFIYASDLAKQESWELALNRLTEIKQMFIAANTGDEEKLANMGLPSPNAFFTLAKSVLKNHPDINKEKWLGEIKRLNHN
jgi:tetratricopeptide (TPR) repeat protein